MVQSPAKGLPVRGLAASVSGGSAEVDCSGPSVSPAAVPCFTFGCRASSTRSGSSGTSLGSKETTHPHIAKNATELRYRRSCNRGFFASTGQLVALVVAISINSNVRVTRSSEWRGESSYTSVQLRCKRVAKLVFTTRLRPLGVGQI